MPPEDWTKVSKEVDWTHAWSNLYYFTPINVSVGRMSIWQLAYVKLTQGSSPSPTARSIIHPADPLDGVGNLPAPEKRWTDAATPREVRQGGTYDTSLERHGH